MAAAEKFGDTHATCGVTLTGHRDFEDSDHFRRDLTNESRYESSGSGTQVA
jgi:uncharacterized phage protein gp47/JayE